jgi:hypothetical protein
MFARIAMIVVGLASTFPAAAAEMRADEARRFVVGRLFAFHCFEGTTGAGRVHADGSVAGVIRLQGAGPMRYVALPAGTLHVKGEFVCARLKGVAFEPCFNLEQTDEHSFRGSVTGLSFASCTFTRRGGRTDVVRTNRAPLPIQSAIATSKAD